MLRWNHRPIEIDLWIFFPKAPLACMSDNPKDTIDLRKCVEILNTEISNKPFVLMEHLAYELHSALKKQLPMHLDIALRVTPLDPKMSFMYFPKKETQEEKKSRPWEFE